MIDQIVEDSVLACGGQGAGKSLHDPGPDEHSSIGHPRHMHHLSVHTQQRGHGVEDGLRVGQVIPT